MRVQQLVLTATQVLASDLVPLRSIQPQLVLAFGSVPQIHRAAPLLRQVFQGSQLLGCSTAGEISQSGVSDDSLVVTAIHFDAVTVRQSSTPIASMADSHAAGQRLAQGLPLEGLRAVMVLSQGVEINGSALVQGMAEHLGKEIPITGGLAGDGSAFVQTVVLDNDGASSDRLTCVGFYGDSLQVSTGSFGGWSPFGPTRKVTRSVSNILYELDGEAALSVYKRYLGDYARDLPASGLLFPFAMLGNDHRETGLIRTVMSVDELQGSVTLAGEIDPQGYLRLMHASTDALVDGASDAASAALGAVQSVDGREGLGLLVSCVGRKLMMGVRVDEEVDAVREVLGAHSAIAGFYSFGEISPMQGVMDCKLHNQTMTITYFSENAAEAEA